MRELVDQGHGDLLRRAVERRLVEEHAAEELRMRPVPETRPASGTTLVIQRSSTEQVGGELSRSQAMPARISSLPRPDGSR